MKNKTRKQALSAFLAVAILLCSAPLSGLAGIEMSDLFSIEASAETHSGSCGNDVYWSLDTETGVLNINGTGNMKSYFDEYIPPWYSYRLSIKTIKISNGITKIGANVFESCENLTLVSIPDSVEFIGNGAFANCKALTSVMIPDGVKEISGYAFNGCESLTSITFPDSVEYIGEYVLTNCNNLTSIVVGVDNPNYSSDENGVLYNKDKTELIQYPVGDTRTSFIIPYGVKSIAHAAFYACGILDSIVIPESVESIGISAFAGCKNLNSITIPKKVKKIDECVFEYCISLTLIDVDEDNPNYSSDENGVLYNKDKTELIQYPVGNTRTAFIIPSSVKNIDSSAFYGCKSLKSVTVPDGMKSIKNYAFYGCEALNSITIPDSVANIGTNAFFKTAYYNNQSNWENDVLYINNHLVGVKTSLSGSYEIKPGTKTIVNGAFENCKELTSVIVPGSLKNISDFAFYSCDNLTSVIISDGVKNIGEVVFYGCKKLDSISIADSVESIGMSSFGDTAYYNNPNNWENDVLYINNNLVEAKASLSGSYTIKPGTKAIADFAFNSCDELCSVVIPDSVKYIGSAAFIWCDKITSVTIGAGTEKIVYDAFYACDSLVSFVVDEKNQNYSNDAQGVLYNKDKTQLIQYPIGKNRTSFVVPDSVEIIGKDAFTYCNLTSVTIGKKVKAIDVCAFAWCSDITDVYYNGTEERWNEISIDAGNGDLINATIHFKQLTSINFESDSYIVTYRDSIKVVVTPDVETDAEIVYFIGDATVATVDEDGNITTVGPGTATITATIDGTTISDTCTISVQYTWWQWIIMIVLFGWIWY